VLLANNQSVQEWLLAKGTSFSCLIFKAPSSLTNKTLMAAQIIIMPASTIALMYWSLPAF
jgi:hypothetical protein